MHRSRLRGTKILHQHSPEPPARDRNPSLPWKVYFQRCASSCVPWKMCSVTRGSVRKLCWCALRTDAILIRSLRDMLLSTCVSFLIHTRLELWFFCQQQTIWAYTYMYVHTHTYTYVYIQMHADKCNGIHMHTNIYMHTRTATYVYMHISIYTHITYIYMCVCVRMSTCTYV